MAPTKKKKPAAKAKAKPSAKIKPAVKKNSLSAVAPKIQFQPLNDRLLISVDAAPLKTAGGLIIPGTAAERPSRGKVMAKGPGRRNKKGALRPLDVKVGDMIMFPQYAGTKIEMNGEEFLILGEEEVLAISIA